MKFNKELFKTKVEEKLKTEGKEHLMEFIEDIVDMSWEIIKIAALATEEFMWDDMVVQTVDSSIKKLIDGIHAEKAE